VSELNIETPKVFLPIFKKKYRYIGAYGGRGSGKSHFFAELLIERCIMQRTDAVCIREIQKSLNQSVKKLLEIKIEKLGAQSLFEIQETVIKCKNGGQIIFQGMQNHTADSIKSLEGYDIAWVEEAQSLSQRSLDLLRPTIRKDGSEIWFTWNPRKQTDPVDVFMRNDANNRDDSICIKVNYSDNPWFPDVLRDELEYDKKRDYDKYRHVWEGEYEQSSKARVFNNFTIKKFTRPPGTIFRFGADWGFANDPTVLIRSSIDNNALYIDYEAYMVGCEIDNTPDLFDSVPLSNRYYITADSARPELISYMKKRGFKIKAAKKGANSIKDGIEFLKSFDIIVHPRCENVIYELNNYNYKVDKLTGDILPEFEDKHNHCIAEGVMITTDSGLKAIENVTTNDKVLTRNGYRNVLWAGETDTNRQILKLKTTGGVLYCTPDHEVYTENRGFVRADALSYNDDILNTEGLSCKALKQLSIKERFIGDTQIAIDKAIEIISKGQLLAELSFFTEGYGSTQMEKYRKDFTSITKMKTQLITIYQILNALAQENTLIDTNGLKIGENFNGGTLIQSGISLKSGTLQKKESKNIERLAQLRIRNLSQFISCAKTVITCLNQTKLATLTNIVQINANQQQDENQVLTMKKGCVSAEINLQQTNTQKQNIAQGRVLAVTDAGIARKVYDITVEHDHEFFANGVLVHNCIDALRYAAEAIRKNKEREIIDYGNTISFTPGDTAIGY